jgi:hypothetical protein
VNQNDGGGVSVARFLVMNPNTVDIDEERMLGMKYNVAALVPISIAWTQEQLAGNGNRCSPRDPVTFLHPDIF